MPRATIVGRSTASGRPWRPSTGRGATSASVRPSCPPCTPVPGSPGAMPSWARSPRAVPSGKKGSGLPRRWQHPGSLMLASLGARSAVPPPRRPAQGAPPARTGLGLCQDADLPALVPLDGCGLGGGVYPGRARRRRRAAAHAGDGTDHRHGTSRSFRRSVVSPWGRRSCWPAAWRRRTPSPSGAGARP